MDKAEFLIEFLEILTKHGYDPVSNIFLLDVQKLVNPAIDKAIENEEMAKAWVILSNRYLHEEDPKRGLDLAKENEQLKQKFEEYKGIPWDHAKKTAPIWEISEEIGDILDGTPGTWGGKIRKLIKENEQLKKEIVDLLCIISRFADWRFHVWDKKTTDKQDLTFLFNLFIDVVFEKYKEKYETVCKKELGKK